VNQVGPTGDGKCHSGGIEGGFVDGSTSCWFPVCSWGYHLYMCMLYRLNVKLVRPCMEPWPNQYHQIPDRANRCGVHAAQKMRAAGGPIAGCPTTGVMKFESPGQYRSPRPSPHPLPKLPND